MNNKSSSLDIIAYFFRVVIIVLTGIILFLLLKNSIELFTILFSNLERKYCTYGSIKLENNLVSKFININFIESYGSYSHVFIRDESTNVLGITIFLRVFEVLKYLYLLAIGLLSFILFNNYSKNSIENKKNRIYLTIISIMIILIPVFLLIKDFIGCEIIKSYDIKDPLTSIKDFKFIFVLIGTILLLINFNYFNNLKFKKIIFISLCTLFGLYFLISGFKDLINLISTIKMSSKECEYYELIKVRHSFLQQLFQSFNLFGNTWTYLGIYTNLKTSMIVSYILNSITHFSIAILSIILIVKLLLNKTINFNNYLLMLLLITIFILLKDLIVNLLVVNSYKKQDFPNRNLKYNILNFSNFYLIWFSLFTYLTSFKNNKKEEF